MVDVVSWVLGDGESCSWCGFSGENVEKCCSSTLTGVSSPENCAYLPSNVKREIYGGKVILTDLLLIVAFP